MASDGTGETEIWTETGGKGSPTLILIHGLGANGTVWVNGLTRIRVP